MKTTLVLGASLKSYRASFKAIEKLQNRGDHILAIGRQEGNINSTTIHTSWPESADIHTITIYLNHRNQNEYENMILESGAKRIIFNPGAENISLLKRAKLMGMEVLNACTLVMLTTNDY